MENHTPRTITLKVKIHYSDENIQKLKRRFLRFDGVDKVEVEAQHELLRISGTVDPLMLIKYLESKNIKAEFYKYDINIESVCESDKPKKPNPEAESARNGDRTPAGSGEGKNRGKTTTLNGRKMGRKPHVCEPYEPLKIDALICRDPYCKLHKSRSVVSSKVPSINSEDHPRHMHGHGFSLPGAFGNQPLMFGGGPSLYGLGHAHMPMMEPPYSSFGLPPARNHMPGLGNFGSYGDQAAIFRGPFM